MYFRICCDFSRYLQQFQDLYTEEGRKSVKISSYIPTQHQAMIQAQNKNKVKVEPNRTPSPCQGQKTDSKTTTTNGTSVKTQGQPISGNKMAVNTLVKNDGSSATSQSIPGKIPIYNTSSLAASTSGMVMTGTNSNLAGMAVQGIVYWIWILSSLISHSVYIPKNPWDVYGIFAAGLNTSDWSQSGWRWSVAIYQRILFSFIEHREAICNSHSCCVIVSPKSTWTNTTWRLLSTECCWNLCSGNNMPICKSSTTQPMCLWFDC